MGWLLSSWRWIVALRWWQRVGAAFLLAILAIGGLRLHGQWRWQRVQADIAAAGLPTTVADLLRDQPPIDRDRQERLWQALQDLEGIALRPYALPFSRLQTQAPCGRGLVAADLLRDGEAAMRTVAAVLDEGPVWISQAGWTGVDETQVAAFHQALRQPTVPLVPPWRSTPPEAVRTCANWWGCHALASGDPRPDLRALARWNTAVSVPILLIDVVAAESVSAIRDEVCLWLATRGRFPADELDAWIAEPAQQRGWSAQGLAGERIVFSVPSVHLPIPWVSPVMDAFWVTKAHQLAYNDAHLATLEAVLRDRTAPRPCPQSPFGLGVLSLGIPNMDIIAAVATEDAFRHRLRRIAGVLAAAYRAGRPLPADATAVAACVPAHLLVAAGPNHPAMRYERLAPARFRIGCDPARPPFFHDAARWNVPGERYGSAIGESAATRAVDDRRYSLELDLDAILAPAKRGR